jgi:hypothetical protein
MYYKSNLKDLILSEVVRPWHADTYILWDKVEPKFITSNITGSNLINVTQD